jgi:steroid delta-isomerase-like uncharacterized protein
MMTAMNSVLDMQSSHTELGDQIVLSVVDKLNKGKAADAVDHFDADFKFNDHGLGLEFNNKARLEEFFDKTHELFPDAQLNVTAMFASGNHVVVEWTFTATYVEPFWPRGESRVPRSLLGVSIVAITGGRINERSDYYDSRTARRSRIADFFTDWVEL